MTYESPDVELLLLLWYSKEGGDNSPGLANEGEEAGSEKRNVTGRNTTVESIESIVLPEKGAAEKEHSSSLGAGPALNIIKASHLTGQICSWE